MKFLSIRLDTNTSMTSYALGVHASSYRVLRVAWLESVTSAASHLTIEAGNEIREA